MKFTKEILSSKSLEELKIIAAENGVKSGRKTHSALVLDILDKLADTVSSIAEKTSARKRTRMKTVDHIYSATQETAVRMGDKKSVVADNSYDLFSTPQNDGPAAETPDGAATNSEAGNAAVDVPAAAQTEPDATVSAAPRKRGRKPAGENQKKSANGVAEAVAMLADIVTDDDNDDVANEATSPADEHMPENAGSTANEPSANEPPKKKRGRPRKNPQPEAEVVVTATPQEQPAVAVEQEMPAEENAIEENPQQETTPAVDKGYDDGSDFIIIRDVDMTYAK